MQTYYQTLEVDPVASFDQIKAAYRKLALRCHPDRGGSHAQMVRINEAWEVLSDSELRKSYDVSLATGEMPAEQFEDARQRSKSYARDWGSFDKWLSSIERDFVSAKFSSKPVMGMPMPTASGSVSAWAFLITGGLIGLLVWVAIFVSVAKAWAPQKEARTRTTSNRFLPGVDIGKKQNNSTNPIFVRIAGVALFASIAGGAWWKMGAPALWSVDCELAPQGPPIFVFHDCHSFNW